MAVLGALITVFIVVPTTVETLSRGRSLGKLVCGLRAVRDDAGPISFQHAFVRALVGVVEIYAFTGAPAFFSALLSEKGKRLGDHAAGTYVVRERVRLRLAQPALAAAAPGALGPLGRHDVPADRALARRTPVPRPRRRPRPGDARRPGRPAGGRGCGPRRSAAAPRHVAHDFLAAVIASRRERDVARLAREAAMRARLVGKR